MHNRTNNCKRYIKCKSTISSSSRSYSRLYKYMGKIYKTKENAYKLRERSNEKRKTSCEILIERYSKLSRFCNVLCNVFILINLNRKLNTGLDAGQQQ